MGDLNGDGRKMLWMFSLNCLWLGKPVLDFLYLVKGLGQNGVMKHSLNQLEAFLPLQL